MQRHEKIESALACAHDELAKSKQLAHENAMVAQQNAAAAESLLGLVEQANKRAGYNRGPRGRLGPLGAMGAALGKVMPRFFGHTP